MSPQATHYQSTVSVFTTLHHFFMKLPDGGCLNLISDDTIFRLSSAYPFIQSQN